jgi:hypothetical protein
MSKDLIFVVRSIKRGETSSPYQTHEVFFVLPNTVQCLSYQHMTFVYPPSFGCLLMYLGGTELFKLQEQFAVWYA